MRRIHLGILLLLTLAAHACQAQEVVDQWRYTLRRPGEGWQQAAFDDRGWQSGAGGFGTLDTPGARVGTSWATNAIWLRKTMALEVLPQRAALLIHHDEDVEVFLNGKRLFRAGGFTRDYKVVPLRPEQQQLLRIGKNQLAVHCRQTTGGQFIDVHIIDANHVPQLPTPRRTTKPFQSELTTEWGEKVTAQNAWRTYPRPQLRRDNWTNLNGHWEYAVTPIGQQGPPTEFAGKILVPYCLESKLGGVQRLLDATEALWYRRTFQVSKSDRKRLLLNFEAVDYRTQVFVNGKRVGEHVGGNTPFSFDITAAARNGENELLVRVEDATEGYQLRGKQVINARGIWYTQVSGIWQTVWLEEAPELFAERIRVGTKMNGNVRIDLVPNGRIAGSLPVEAIVRQAGQEVARAKGSGSSLSLKIKRPELWSPASPTLYDLELHVAEDVVHSYFGIREVGKVQDAAGHWRFTLNGEPLFHWGPLDQGWWPDGLLTPPSDSAMVFDIQWLKSAGYNMIRKHIKVEPRRYYYHCDRLGMLVWQDHVSGGLKRLGAWPDWTRLKPNPRDAQWPAKEHQQFMIELDRMITALENHPSIVSWVPFNERWGQHQTMLVGTWTVERDRSRLINVASGGNFWPVGDVLDAHSYPQPVFPFEDGKGGRFKDYIKVMGEFGGHGYPVAGHLWDPSRRNWGYGGLPQNKQEYRERYVTSLKLLDALRHQGIAGGVYTQTTDVEGEVNGLLTYDRKVAKIPAHELAELHKLLFLPLADE